LNSARIVSPLVSIFDRFISGSLYGATIVKQSIER
jgi:hypothetical protein